MDTLNSLINYGQSYWLDNLARKKISSGELTKRVTEQGLRGITSNPSIFDKAIANSTDYDAQIKSLVKEGKTPQQIYDALTIKDVQDACDILKPVHTQSNGTDGFVSLEVSPYLAYDTQGTMKETRRLFKLVGRPNCLIKIPGTKEGIPAIEQMLYEGININITLIFSSIRYAEIANAYVHAVERRLAEGKTINNVISVASIFISRIDTLVDHMLGQRIIPFEGSNELSRPELLLGKAGVATARICYQQFKEIFYGERWERLESKGAYIQRLLWASTSNKDPLYDKLGYIEPLIGKGTINTLTDDSIAILANYGVLKENAIEDNVEQAIKLFAGLKKDGIEIEYVTKQLEFEGVQKFTDAYNKLLSSISDKRMKILESEISSPKNSYGKLETEINALYSSIDEKQIGRLLFAEDPLLWKKDEEQTKEISHRLGWLTLPDDFIEDSENIIEFVNNIKQEYTCAVLLGMGGSSLCSEVARETFDTEKGYLKLFVLDNTSPEAILELQKKIDIEKTLFIVASKSGSTKETLCFFRYFYNQVKSRNHKSPGNNFIAITDGGTPLVKIAEEYKFRKVFVNPPDLGGRYSVLSDFGLVPMALMGIDIKAMLESAKKMEDSCDSIPAAVNPGVSLGVVLGACQKHGRDKVTFVLSSSIASFGYWLEQLLAESTGKQGLGLVPINGEILGSPEVYGNDRVFIHMYLASDDNMLNEEKLKLLEDAGHPIVRIKLADIIALGAEYYRWEIAVAIAGIVIGINSFDQPNVEESKKNTDRLLAGWSKEGSFTKSEPLLHIDAISIYGGAKTKHLTDAHHESIGDFVKSFIEQAKPNEYVALLPYFAMTEYRSKILDTWRQHMRDELKEATTLLNGPRYLHSTGQLHKGGPDTGLYIIIIGAEEEHLPIPDEKYGFEVLHQAQALGDFYSLDEKGRRVIRIHLGKDIDEGLNKLYLSVTAINKLHFQHETV